MNHRSFVPKLRSKLSELRATNPEIFKENGALKPSPERDAYIQWYLEERKGEIASHDKELGVDYYRAQALAVAKWLHELDTRAASSV
jgi:hypothetical protein